MTGWLEAYTNSGLTPSNLTSLISCLPGKPVRWLQLVPVALLPAAYAYRAEERQASDPEQYQSGLKAYPMLLYITAHKARRLALKICWRSIQKPRNSTRLIL